MEPEDPLPKALESATCPYSVTAQPNPWPILLI